MSNFLPPDLPLPSYIEAKGPNAIQTWLALKGIRVGLPVVRRWMAQNAVSKAFLPGLKKPGRVIKPVMPKGPRPQPKLNMVPDKVFANPKPRFPG